ncbi:probable L-type lectin-domain containing receptor kinase S.5 [Rhododendron vialii]|uniref:probable L-type lectin-domain containing receptor kinase S.5 n=1 Tax=Rhododendron vialii TaxID=182163 RepID=UPI00265F4941|nr:probable L-type lectin-domain containing receptor kinase S.5 [Rhododendron vialii]
MAVKWFSQETIKDRDDFLAGLTIINRLRHKNLVRLLDSKPLSWDLRYMNIISGVALALNYLHNEYDQTVVHRVLKASNIMLDFDFNARLGDFGLARALEKEKTSYIEAKCLAGTLGYIAPECFLTGKATDQFDVYAFSVVLLEIVCGLRPGARIDEFHCSLD